MRAILLDELRLFLFSNNFRFASDDTTNRQLLPTGFSLRIDSLPAEELGRRQRIFSIFDRLINGNPFLIWKQQDRPAQPHDELHYLVSVYRRGVDKLIAALGISKDAAGIHFLWREFDLAVILIFVMTCITAPGYSDLYIMPEGKGYIIRIDHDDIVTVECLDQQVYEWVKGSWTVKLENSEAQVPKL